jgi:PIN domain nuclease of toxin-antitoxin system
MDGSIYLLDTHTLIWFQENNPKITEQVMNLIRDLDNTILFTQISLFEIGIKLKIGKLLAFSSTVQDVYQQAIEDGFIFVTIQNQHIYNYEKVPLFENHRDPFDRLIVATAIIENAIILSADEKLAIYDNFVKVLW